jgi:antitoxin HicB
MQTTKKRNKHIGSSLHDFLKGGRRPRGDPRGRAERNTGLASSASDGEGQISKVKMARRMNTSRAALDRLLHPGNASVVPLQTLSRAAHAVGRDLRIELV